MSAFICKFLWFPVVAGSARKNKRENEIPARFGARVQQGNGEGRYARRDHQLRPIPAKTSRGIYISIQLPFSCNYHYNFDTNTNEIHLYGSSCQ